MSNKSYPIKENSNVMKVQGGEQKVMKKILTVALSTAMAFSMFASVAFGDSATAVSVQDKFDSLKAKGIFNGYPDGSAHLEKDMTRAEFAKVITKLLGLKEVTGTLSYKDKGYDAKNWAVPYIEAVTAAGIMEGQDTVKKIFNYNGQVTVQEMATVLTRALKLEVPADADNSASAWAKGYVQAAINKGLISKDLNFQANATRSQLVEAAYTIDQLKNVSVASYKVADNGKDVEFTLNTGEVVKVTLEKALEANKETEVTFKNAAGQEIKAKITWVVTSATKVQNVAADNLKEVVVTFDGEVDKATAELKDNYKLSDSQAVKTAVLNDAKNAVTLTLEGNLRNQAKYNLSVSGVKAGNKTISVSNYEFAPVDNKLPEVVSVTSLGTKAVKVVFSEPVKQTLTGSFLLDGQGFYGSPSVDGRELVIKAPTALSVGEHTLSVANVEDFNSFKSLKSEHKFTVAEDNTAPTISEATATLEKLTVTFSEDIDPDTLDVANVYHKRGDSKLKPNKAVRVSGNKYEFYFDTDKALPTYATTIYVEKVKDYSGNEIKETSKQITATIDTERPEVLDVRVNPTNKSQLVVTFSKDLADNQSWTKLITVKDKDGKVRQVSGASLKSSDAKNILLVNFFSELPEGTNTLDIKGIKDNTVLGNVLADYSTTFSINDSGSPKVAGASFKIDNDARRAVIYFSEAMDVQSLTNYSNYILTFNNSLTALPSSANIAVIEGGKGVVIDLPVQIGGIDVNSLNWTGIKVQGVKDLSGNYLENYFKDITVGDYSTLKLSKTYNSDKDTASLTSSKEIKVQLDQAVAKFNGNLGTVSVKVNGNTKTVTNVVANNSDVITVKLADDVYSNENLVVTFTGTSFVGVAQNNITLGSATTPAVVGDATYTIADEVAPSVKLSEGQTGYPVTTTGSTYSAIINFTEALDVTIPVNLLAQDFVVTRLTGGTATIPVATGAAGQNTYFQVVVDPANHSKLIVKITDPSVTAGEGKYSIEVRENAKYIQDKAGNTVDAKEALRTFNAN
ncbi:hypothetical protein GRF59_23575 [Paenibacillus sp. HJL G12]|uniref:SLH domain-containing protein n=1 Tax=Paenibacillus dendrobii TaxID=2691084 RepID=A0A7X3IQW3_9BACL|nr:Ig-like domain-containing protein [Paenibacillus dendrobii]MWV46592.1 hypothetical protein [Paenibacillus dendrobii]